MNIVWTPARIAQIRAMREADISYDAIGRALDVTASSAKAAYKRHVIGRADTEMEAARTRARRGPIREWERGNAVLAEKRRRRRAEGETQGVREYED